MDSQTVYLIEAASSELVEAVLNTRLTAEQVAAAEAVWAEPRRTLPDPEHAHWDWVRKAPLLSNPGVACFGVLHAGDVQGLMMIAEAGHVARLPTQYGSPLVYVDFLEAAPWNQTDWPGGPRYRGAGSRLVCAAVHASLAAGCHGRIGLHSLRGAEGFYEERCRMSPWGEDPEYHGLMYYEFTANAAADFLRRAES